MWGQKSPSGSVTPLDRSRCLGHRPRAQASQWDTVAETAAL